MKIGILTHPQDANYGGILQCYALSQFLKKLGHEPIVIRREPNKSFFLWEWVRSFLGFLHFPRYYQPKGIDRSVNIRPFVEKNIRRTPAIRSIREMNKVCGKNALDAVIVGSDQVWRASYALRFGYNYFLDFVPDNIIKASYAASFGVGEWNYSQQQTMKIGKLLRRFNGISVREEEGVTLLERQLGMKAIQHIDPTMLLTKEEYEKVTSPRLEEDKYVFVYWLGEKEKIADSVKDYNEKGYKVVEVFLRDEKEQISVEDWLSYIKYADLVLTDSFHGCVFSLLFESPFRVFQNHSGGVGRVASLMNQFEIKVDTTINYSLIQSLLDKYRIEAKNYLQNILE